MAGRLARCLCASSLLYCAAAGAQVRERPFLSQQQLEQPAAVVAWLKKHGAAADRQRAARAHAFGVEEEARGSLDTALKAYGESAIRLPTPGALITYARLATRYYGRLRAARGDHHAFQDADLRSVEMLYRSALASDDVLTTLSARERRQIAANAQCIATFRGANKQVEHAGCAPLLDYGVRR